MIKKKAASRIRLQFAWEYLPSYPLNTMSWTHEEIFGAKFLSFEHAAIVYWHTADYAAEKRSVQWMTEQKSIIGFHSATFTL